MSDFPPFDGFPPEYITFFQQLAENNERDWFNEHKPEYKQYVEEPGKALVLALGERLKAEYPDVRYDTRTNGSGSMMRINRDTRFSKDKTPYKDNLSMAFWEGPGKKTAHPAYMLRVHTGGSDLLVGMYGFDKAMLAAYRDAVVDDKKGPALQAALAQIERTGGYHFAAPHYKKVPRGYDADHPRADLLKYNSIHATYIGIPTSVVTSPDFVAVCMTHFRTLAPLQRWLVDVQRSI